MAEVRIRIKYLSAVRDRTNRKLDEVSLEPGSTLAEAAAWLVRAYGLVVPGPQILCTLNGKGWTQLAESLATPLADGDEIALFPLVSGG